MDSQIIAKVQRLGFDVWMRRTTDTYMIFSDPATGRIGYLQDDLYGGGFTLSTVHKPNSITGTGFQILRHAPRFNKADLESCFHVAPANWPSRRDIESVHKYRDMAEYRASDSFKAEYGLVPPVEE